MAPIVSEVDVARPPDEVFRYVTDPARFGEWQSGVISAHIEGGAPQAVGSRCVMTRRIGGSDRTSTSEITELSPHVTIQVDFRGQGTGSGQPNAGPGGRSGPAYRSRGE